MVFSVKHAFQSAKSDSSDASLVRASNWNEEHAITMASGRLLGRAGSGTGVVEEITLSSDLAFSGSALGLSASMVTTINGKAPLASPAFTGTPTAPTPTVGDNSTKLATTAFVAATTGGGGGPVIPPGVVMAFTSLTIPSGWLKCDGAAISRTTYSALYNVIGQTFGAGNGSTTFNLPDLRGEFIRGLDEGRGIDPVVRTMGSIQAHSLQQHNHRINYIKNNNTAVGGSADRVAQISGTDSWDTSATVIPIGNSGAETRPRNMSLVYIIKT